MTPSRAPLMVPNYSSWSSTSAFCRRPPWVYSEACFLSFSCVSCGSQRMSSLPAHLPPCPDPEENLVAAALSIGSSIRPLLCRGTQTCTMLRKYRRMTCVQDATWYMSAFLHGSCPEIKIFEGKYPSENIRKPCTSCQRYGVSTRTLRGKWRKRRQVVLTWMKHAARDSVWRTQRLWNTKWGNSTFQCRVLVLENVKVCQLVLNGT